MPREEFDQQLAALRHSLLQMATLVESQIETALEALQQLDREGARRVRRNDRQLNEIYREIRERCFTVIATQQPVARDLRALMGVIYISAELERMGDYAVLIGRRTGTLIGLPPSALQAEFGLLGRLAIRQVRDILDALIEHSETKARQVAARDGEIDSLYHKVFDELISDLSSSQDPDAALRAVTLIRMAHHLERIGDRVTNVAEDIVFLESGEVVELG